MRVYFHHNQNLNYIWKEWEKGMFPAHLLYGATHLNNYQIEVIQHDYTRQDKPRWWRALDTFRKVIKCKGDYDALYATRYNGIEIFIVLRALGLYRKPIIVWQHQPVLKSTSWYKDILSRIFFRGIDYFFFFSDYMRNVSISSGKVKAEKTKVCPWGADLQYYDRLMRENPVGEHSGFISTGKEHRDMETLISAFGKCQETGLTLIAAAECCGDNYEQMLSKRDIPQNVNLIINRTMWIPELAKYIWKNKCVCICCKETNYTVGLTTLVEALAMGLPVIISRNPNQPFDVGEEGCGISVPYGDVDGWVQAIQYIDTHPDEVAEMGRRARQLSERTYNIEKCSQIVAEAIKKVCREKS